MAQQLQQSTQIPAAENTETHINLVMLTKLDTSCVQGHPEFTLPPPLSEHTKKHKQNVKGELWGFVYVQAWSV